ncbi:6-phosphogluconolactonase [soil metagenome]
MTEPRSAGAEAGAAATTGAAAMTGPGAADAGAGATTGPGAERPRVVVLADAETVAQEAAAKLLTTIAAAVAARGRADVALTGGSSALALYPLLTAPSLRDRVDWERVHLWLGDERYVPPDHPESNARLVNDALLRTPAHGGQSGSGLSGTDVIAGLAPHLDAPVDQFHPFPITEALRDGYGPEWTANQYEAALRAELPADPDGLPVFDLVLLGVGPDGHILSVFPGSAALDPSAAMVLSVPAPDHVEPHLPRITLNPRLLRAAHAILVMAPGEGKADVLAQVLGSERDPARWPAQLALLPQATWLLDRASAAKLEEPAST